MPLKVSMKVFLTNSRLPFRYTAICQDLCHNNMWRQYEDKS